MVQEILKNIEEKAEERLLEIEERKKQAILALEKKYSQMQKEQKERSFKAFKMKVEAEIQEFSQKKGSELEFAVLDRKNKIIDGLYDKAAKEIKPEILKKLVTSLFPKHVEGKIRAGKKTAEFLGQITDKQIADDLEEEGFVIESEDADLDFRISEVLKQSKQDHMPELIKLLFY